jgi:hypothetical protein
MKSSLEEAIAAQLSASALPAAIEDLFRRWPKEDYGRVCAIAAHTLRHRGASVQEWQPWLVLSAWGALLQDNARLARALALVTYVYPDIAKHLPASEPTPHSVEYHALTHVLGLSPATKPPALPSAERLSLIEQGLDFLTRDECYAMLADAIARRDWEQCRKSFDELAELVLEGGSGEWNAEFNPGYEPIPAALAAVGRDAGFPLEQLSDEAKGCLWPTLESRPGALPASWPIAA